MAKRQRITLGSILEINIDNEYNVYAQILNEAGYAFFDYKSSNSLNDFSLLQKSPVLFIIGVYDDVITQGRWLKVGKMELRDDLKVQPMQFIHDQLKPGKFELYDPNTGDIKPSTKEECKGLECASVWEGEEVEERIRDHYAGRLNRLVEEDQKLFE